MSESRVEFAEDKLSIQAGLEEIERLKEKPTRFKEKHTLDSDEEDEEKYDVLAEDDIEGETFI